MGAGNASSSLNTRRCFPQLHEKSRHPKTAGYYKSHIIIPRQAQCLHTNSVPAVFGSFIAGTGSRTRDLRTTNATLYHLSHASNTLSFYIKQTTLLSIHLLNSNVKYFFGCRQIFLKHVSKFSTCLTPKGFHLLRSL